MKNKKRTQIEMPKRSQVVKIVSSSGNTSAHIGRHGVVKHRTVGNSRPYRVRFNDGKERLFRTNDVILAD